jgi:hypothetical protein
VSRHASAQATCLGLAAIEDGAVTLASGGRRGVLEVTSVNFALRGEAEQEATLAAYAALLNALGHPLQVLVRVLPIDVERYLGDLEAHARRERSPKLAELGRDHVAFLRREARERTLLERRFYVVVPVDGPPARPRGWLRWPFRRRPAAPAAAVAAARRLLTVRCEEVERQLARCGLAARRLGDAELAQLYHACWCADLARVQRLRGALAEHTALVVGAERRPPCPS